MHSSFFIINEEINIDVKDWYNEVEDTFYWDTEGRGSAFLNNNQSEWCQYYCPI